MIIISGAIRVATMILELSPEEKKHSNTPAKNNKSTYHPENWGSKEYKEEVQKGGNQTASFAIYIYSLSTELRVLKQVQLSNRFWLDVLNYVHPDI